jgi:hypothetical protein
MIGAEPFSLTAVALALISWITPDPTSTLLLTAAAFLGTFVFVLRKKHRAAMFVPCLFVWYTVVVHYRPGLNIF